MFVEANSIVVGFKKGKIIHPVDEYIFTKELTDKYDYSDSFNIIDDYFEVYKKYNYDIKSVIVYVDEMTPELMELVNYCYCNDWDLSLRYYDTINNNYRFHVVLSKQMKESSKE